jgi:hypothetical protein
MENELSRIPLILLAGGKSFRVGFPKGLMPVGEKTWVECQCEKFEKIGGKDAILVLGFDAEAYSEAGKRLQAPQYISQLNMQVVINPLPEHGPFSSIQAGIKVALEMNSTDRCTRSRKRSLARSFRSIHCRNSSRAASLSRRRSTSWGTPRSHLAKRDEQDSGNVIEWTARRETSRSLRCFRKICQTS